MKLRIAMPDGPTPAASPDAGDVPALALQSRGLTVREVAQRYRVSSDKIRAWIQRRELLAVNTSRTLCGKPRWVITAEALADFEGRRQGGSPPKPQRRRRTAMRDYYPGD